MLLQSIQKVSKSCFCLNSFVSCVACLFRSNARSPTFTSVTAVDVWAGLKSFCAARKKNTSKSFNVLHVLQHFSTATVAAWIQKMTSFHQLSMYTVFAIYDAEPGHETTACSCCQATDLAAQWSDPPKQQALGLQCSNNIKFSDLKICIKRNASYGIYIPVITINCTCTLYMIIYHQYVIRLDIHTGSIHHHTPSYTLWTHGAQDVHSMCKLFRGSYSAHTFVWNHWNMSEYVHSVCNCCTCAVKEQKTWVLVAALGSMLALTQA